MTKFMTKDSFIKTVTAEFLAFFILTIIKYLTQKCFEAEFEIVVFDLK